MKFVFWLVILCVGLAPLPLGANRPWAWSLLAVLVGLALALAVLRGLRNPAALPIPFSRYRVLAAGFTILALWIALQAMSWTPASWHDPSWLAMSAALDIPYHGAISADPAATLDSLMRILTYGALFWLGLQLGGHDRPARLLCRLVVLFTVLYASYGLILHFSGSHKVLWFDKWASQAALTSTFLNRNHLVTYLGFGIILATAQLIEILRQSISGISLRSRAGLIALGEAIDIRIGFLILCLLILTTTVILAGSRAGLAGIAIGIVTLLTVLALNRRVSPGRAFRFALILGLGLLVLIVMNGEWLIARLATLPDNLQERMALFSTTLSAMAERPWLGTGLGTFEDVFRAYRGDEGLHWRAPYYDYAHNVLLEFALEAGLPALGLLLFLFLVISTVQFRGVGQRRYNETYPAAGLGLTAMVLVHSQVEFSIQIPAIAATYALLIGMAYAQSWRHDDRHLALRPEAKTPEA